MKKPKNLMALVLAVLTMLSSTITAFAAEIENEHDFEKSVVIVEDGMLQQGQIPMQMDGETQIVTVSNIDAIIDERQDAVLRNDQKRYAELTEMLRSYGVEEVTPSEIAVLTGDDAPMLAASETRGGITYETYNTTYTYSGTTYSIRRILATPVPGYSSDTVLYKTGDIDIKNSRTAKADAMAVLGIAVEAGIGLASDKIGIAQTVYSFFKDVSDQLKKTSEITNIKASYTWNTAMACSFVYVLNETNQLYELRGRYHKASASIGVTIPQLSVTGIQDIETSMLQNSHSGTATPVNYNSTLKAVQGFINQKTYQASVEGVKMTGIEKKTIKNITFNLPMTPLEVGY